MEIPRAISEICTEDNCQCCHMCENAHCGDNMTPSIRFLKEELAKYKSKFVGTPCAYCHYFVQATSEGDPAPVGEWFCINELSCEWRSDNKIKALTFILHHIEQMVSRIMEKLNTTENVLMPYNAPADSTAKPAWVKPTITWSSNVPDWTLDVVGPEQEVK